MPFYAGESDRRIRVRARPDAKLLASMGSFNEDLMKAGVFVAATDSKPSSDGKRARFSRSKRSVIDGPFAETKELIGGFWIWQVDPIERQSSGEALPESFPRGFRDRDPALWEPADFAA